ncbi:MAG: serine/threonine protein kinase [Deltaproteobacteria bacterium]|nr:serine/threonine protein kinase [Deltaproteobacteria bacterium]
MKISARYEVLGLLGQGGMGVVYHVRDTTRGRENALKTLAPGRSEDIVERFLTEAQVMFRLEHDNIVRVYDFGKDGETYFLTMELIRGKNLRQLLNARQNKGFPLAEVIRMGVQAADALNYAHSQKPEAVVHRDIKPVNIMIEEETGRVVVTDFGIAKLMADAGGGETQLGNAPTHTVFAGTVPYSAPEQFLAAGGGRRLDARVDIYALGIVLYEIYTGRHFFAGLSAEEVEQHHRSIESGACPVTRVHACDHRITNLPDTPPAFIAIIEKAIARDRHERYKTAAELLADLQACAAVESVQAVVTAREAAEAAGAAEASPTDFRRGGELEQEAKAAQDRGDHARAGELYRNALQAYGVASSQATERRAQRAAQQAKTAMQIVAREATERDVAALAPDAMKQAAQLVATAEASAAQGQYVQATAQFRQAEEAFRAALVAARQAGARQAIEAEMPALRAAREAAEQADAATLATDAFAAAVREQLRLEEALAAGELTRVRELLPKVREGFASAGEEAHRRLHQSVDDARAAMRAAAAEASAAGAATHAKAPFIEAEALAGAAEKLAERGQLELAGAQLGRAADVYRAATAAAVRAGEREVLEQEISAVRAARAEAEHAGATTLAADAFAAAARAQAELEGALAAGELTRVRTLLPKVGEGFTAATRSATVAQASRAAVEARTAMTAARDGALAARAEQLVPDALAKARARARDAGAAEETQHWERAEQLYRDAAKAFDEVRAAAVRRAEEERLAAARAEARSAADAARTRAKDAGARQHAPALLEEADAIVKRAGDAANDTAGMAEATADYARAAERYDAATAEAARVVRRHELRETLAAVEEAKRQALDAGAGRNPDFAAAIDALAAAERALAADELSLVVSSAAAARDRFSAAKDTVERARTEAAADAALADVAAASAEAREAGAESHAAATLARALERQQQALARRHDGDCAAVLPLAAEAEQAFDAALDETLRAAHEAAQAARRAADLAGADDQASGAARKAFATAEQRRDEGKRVAAAGAFRKAAEGYRAASEARAAAARTAAGDAEAARAEADRAEAGAHAADDQRAALRAAEGAAAALAAGRCAEAERGFAEAARGFRAAAKTATREKQRAGALAARAAAGAAENEANAARAGELAAAELALAAEAFAAAERALETENYAGSADQFAKARDAFGHARDAARRAAAEGEARAARARGEALRATRAPAATGFFARRKLAKADAALARGAAAAAGGDFPRATVAYAEAVQLFEAMPAAEVPPPVAPPPAAVPPAGKKATRAAPPAEATSVVASPALGEATAIASASALEGATLVASEATSVANPPDAATLVGRPMPATVPARGLPGAWIWAGAAGVALLAGVWLMRGGSTDTMTTPSTPPKVAAKTDLAPQERTEVAPPAPPLEAVQRREPPPPAATTAPRQVAKVEEPPPPPPPAPRIASFEPATTRVAPAGDTQPFRIALAEPAGATYVWSVDGKVVSDATAATATIPARETPQRIAVIARTAGGEARQEWELAALAAPPPPEAPETAPVISGFEPRGKTLQLAPGKRTRFKVTAKGAGGAPLRYAWSIDDAAAGGNTATFDFTAAADEEGTTHEVRAEVTSGSGPAARTAWTVTVPNAPVTITRQVPSPAEIVADLGDTTDFSVEARAGRAPESALSYVWTVDKRPAEGADGPRFRYRPERGGSADVEVRVEAPDRAAAVRRWTVRAREAAPAAVPTQLAALPPRVAPTPVAPRAGGDPRRELESWIAAYRDAYQQKNVDRLVTLGVLKPENRGKLADALNDLNDLEVRIAGSSIDVQGPDSAVVTLTREDSFDAGGRRQTQAINIKKNLRKVNGAWVAQ